MHKLIMQRLMHHHLLVPVVGFLRIEPVLQFHILILNLLKPQIPLSLNRLGIPDLSLYDPVVLLPH